MAGTTPAAASNARKKNKDTNTSADPTGGRALNMNQSGTFTRSAHQEEQKKKKEEARMELMAKEKKKKTEAEVLKKKQQEEATRLLRQEKEEQELESVEAKKRQEKDLAAKANILQNLEGAIAEDVRRASEEEEEAKQQEEIQRKLDEDKARIGNSENYQRSFREFKVAKANLEGDIAKDERKAKEEEEKAKQQEETKRKSEEDIE